VAEGLDRDRAVGALASRCPGGELQRGRKYEAVVVVGVVADEIHAARSAHDHRASPKVLSKFGDQPLGCLQLHRALREQRSGRRLLTESAAIREKHP
jgi:hypothetical protein